MLRAVSAATLAVALCDVALADAIDGDWCLGSAHFTIEGPPITLPGGAQLQGRYSRHAFSYLAPGTETGGGVSVDMQLLNEETVRLTRTPPAGIALPPEVWKRCKPIS